MVDRAVHVFPDPGITRPQGSGGRRGFVCAALAVLGALPALLGARVVGGAPAARRVLLFPAERSLGSVLTRPRPAPGESPGTWTYHGEARGRVVVAAGAEVRLELGADLAEVSGLARLRPTDLLELSCTGSAVGSSALPDLARLTGLQVLELSNTRITDAALPHLTKLTGLRVLSLSGLRRTGASFEPLRTLTRLECLYLRRCATDADLAHLAGLSRLRCLYLTGCPITDAGLRHLAGLTALEELDVNAARVSERGLMHLAGLTRLQELCVAGRITDEGLAELARLPALCWLELSSRWLTPVAVERTRREVPRLRNMVVHSVPLEVGERVPSLSLPGLDGTPVVLQDLLRSRKAVLVSFWHLRCAPCLVELPLLQRLYPELQRRGVELVAVNTFDPQEEVARHVRAARLTFPVLIGGPRGHHTVAAAFGVSAYPTSYLVDAEGRVRWVELGFDEQALRAALDRL